MVVDPITEEIRSIRRALAANCGNNLSLIFADVREREALDGRRYTSLPPRRPESGDEQPHALERANEPASSGKSSPHAQ